MNEPAWIEHDGSAVCPVPAGHDVEVRFVDGRTDRDRDPHSWNWSELSMRRITHYRDWTAFKQQEAMGKDVPKWIVRRRNELLNGADPHRDDYRSDYAAIVSNAVEAFIAAHEQPPVDPIDRLRDAIEALHGIHFDRDKMEQIVRRAGIDSLAAAGEGGKE